MSIHPSKFYNILFSDISTFEYGDHSIKRSFEENDPIEAMLKMAENALIRLKNEIMKNNFPKTAEADTAEVEDFKPVLDNLLTRFEEICRKDEDEEYIGKFPPETRLRLLNKIDGIFEKLADENRKMEDHPFGEIIADHKVKIDAIRAEQEEKLAKKDPDNKLLEKSKKDCLSIFNKPGSTEANNLKKTYELLKCGNVEPLDLFRANWNYVRLKDSTPWTDAGKQRLSGAVQSMADLTVGLLSPSTELPEEVQQEIYHTAQLECMRSHEFRQLLVEKIQDELSDENPDVSKESMALYALACEVEHAYPGKNGPASGKMPAGSAREKAAEETLKKVQSALEKTYGPGMENLTIEAMKAPGKDGGPSLVEELAQKAFPAPKEVKAEPKPERTSNVSQL